MGNTDFRMERHTMIFRRRFHATPGAVYAAWTDPARLSKWFGPENVTTNVSELEARVGGAWHLVMRMPDGSEYPLKGVYSEVIASERLVFTMDTSGHPAAWHALLDSFRDTPSGAPGGGIVATVTFAKAKSDSANDTVNDTVSDTVNDTVMTVSQRFDEASDRDAHYRMGSPKSWGESFDRLEQLLTD